MRILTRVVPARLLLFGAAFALPVLAFDGSVIPQFNPRGDAPPIRRSGNPVDDNGATCTACHPGTVNSGQGRVVVRAAGYTPGVRQTIEVDLRDPNAVKWGFQLTARLASDPTKQAGSFTADDLTRVRCGPTGGFYAPCDGEQEFASHSFAATDPGRREGKTFSVTWTPPATDVGPVVFYASGNAANNNINFNGDQVYTGSHRIASAACSLTGTPAIRAGGVGNAADSRTTIGPNALISIFGTGFSPAGSRRFVAVNDLLGGRVPTELDCVAVEIDGRRAPLLYTDSGQINAQVPTTVNFGSVPARVILNPGRPNEIRSAPITVALSEYSPAFFTFNGTSIAALNASANNQLLAEASVATGAAPAKPGDIVVLYGTGFGFTDPVYQAGEFAAVGLRDAITVTVGGTTLSRSDILYAGLSPDAPGLYQFNLRLPASAPDGPLPVTIRIGGASTQSGAIIPIRR